MLVAVVAAALLVYDDRPGRAQTFEGGRGYRTVGLSCDADGLEVCLTLYAVPLTKEWPDASMLRLGGYGWLVGSTRQQGLDLAPIALRRRESDDGYVPRLFRTEWTARVPLSLVALTACVLPLAVAVSRLLAKRRQRRAAVRGFAVLPSAPEDRG